MFLVFDLTDKKTYENVYNWHDDIVQTTGKIPLFIISNKQDLEDQVSVQLPDIVKIERDLECKVLLTSALTGKNVDKAFYNLGKKIVEETIKK